MKYTISILIPCLNEKITIKKAIFDAKINADKLFKNKYEIVVADNGSTDGSLEIIRKIKGIKIIQVPVKGYGAALHWGIKNSMGDYVVFADADLSYPFSNLDKFKPLIRGNPDLILGSRIKGTIQKKAMPFLNRYFGTPILTLLIKLLYNLPTTDCNSGMRMVKRSFYNNLNMRNSGMEWASELLLKTAIKRGKYQEVPIKFMKDKRGNKPHLSRWSDGWRHLKSIILLKPVLFIYLMVIFLILSLLAFQTNFGLTSLFILLFTVTLFSFLALTFLGFAIESVHNPVSKLINNNYLVPIVLLFLLIVGLVIYLLPDKHMGTKMLLGAIMSIVLIWVFLIETVKTHLVNRLP
ncbi:hypothetical protein A2422_02415 [Candidatus Woesebacteria bacterium RIFOXYC1_FULL_31_51]|uniref:Dolichol-p-glucose synthetase, Glycosyltransferase n=1 Tax=Candidatus Woesebacteria bacterium GW2011_GWC2_31_9 TaxID=1618586 RepID=A0A0F9YIC7_9BACT|nr:MAG: putative glycosyltransferase [Candidatus Woesebacteria bacterium GW2011_GWF1_31_35]KKP23515.1 MAG: Dolichol-p-glucose synthetase, Glycosyltransferase [Candidatus Woesebacteria bacterium GW2011_GWC1_30_29]KKP25693.1 MAG: Dolichol-p-glucose synthetase, Glycosyltransferase [Candidatus Woesebacteria bacterium GW2011_GWD1_31_12]KKP27791.1 MAG: Dolichol-p-glucose synthetase, Glycosyltransferase [Candidatus Woesebacteria bacterium GW2011_GWB1_31_29]KKP31113.1 MAG: Dolichol-p-glucose synthetase